MLMVSLSMAKLRSHKDTWIFMTGNPTIQICAFPLSKNEYCHLSSNLHTTSPYLHSPVLALPHAWLRKQKQSDWNIIFAICWPLSLSVLYSYSLPLVLLLWGGGERPSSYLTLTNPPPMRGILSLAFSRILWWWQGPPSVLCFWVLPLYVS